MSTPKSPGGPQHAERHRVARADGDRAAVLDARDQRLEVLDRAEEVRLREEDGRHVVAERVGERVRVGDAVAQRDLLDLDPPARAHRAQRLASVRVHPARDQEALALVVLVGEEAGGAERARALVERRVRDGQSGQLADRGLVLEHQLQGALGDLGLVRRVRRQELRAHDDRVHQRRHVVVVHARAEERQLVVGGDVARGQLAQVGVHLLLRPARRQVERAVEPHALRDRLEELVDRLHADALEHRRAVGVGGGGVAAQDSDSS